MPWLKLISWQWWLAIAAILTALGAAWCAQVASLENQISTEKTNTANERSAKLAAEGALDKRIKAEADAIAKAVQAARIEEQTKLATLQGKYDDLLKLKKSDAVVADGARGRLYGAATGAQVRNATCPSPANVPGASTVASRAAPADGAGLHPADRALVDGLLQVGREANSAVRERNLAVETYEENRRTK